MGLPHWLMIAGAGLVVIGFLGLAFARNNQDQTDHPVENEDSVPDPASGPPTPSPQMPGQQRLLDSSHSNKEKIDLESK
jgi:hypothetical protein